MSEDTVVVFGALIFIALYGFIAVMVCREQHERAFREIFGEEHSS